MIRRWGWVPEVFSMEVRKAFSYRVDFWGNFFITVLGELGLAYFLWRAIYLSRGSETLGGFGFHSMMFYYLLVPLVGQIVKGMERGFISDEIYQGTMTRYLIYPIPVFVYKYALALGRMSISFLQMGFAVAVFLLAFGRPDGVQLTSVGLGMGILAILLGSYLYFVMSLGLEMVAFWQDSVWSLLVLLQFSSNFLGGAMIPFSFMPEWVQDALRILPFRVLYDLPVRALMGRMEIGEWSEAMGVGLAWSLIFSWIAAAVWKKGTRGFAGVGI